MSIEIVIIQFSTLPKPSQSVVLSLKSVQLIRIDGSQNYCYNQMIHRTITNKRIGLESKSSCCCFSYTTQLKGEKSLQIKPKSLVKNPQTSTIYRGINIIEDGLKHDLIFALKPTNSIPMKFLPFKQEISTRHGSQHKTQSLLFTPKSELAALYDEEVPKPLQRLRNKRKNSIVSDPLTAFCKNKPGIKFSYLGITQSNFNKAPILIKQNIYSQEESNIKKEIDMLRQELEQLSAETELLKLQKNTNMEHFKTVLFNLKKKQQEIKALQRLRREEVAQLRKEIQSLISAHGM